MSETETPAPAPAPADTGGPLIIVKRTEEEFQDWICTEVGFLSTFGTYGEEPIKFEPYQLAFNDTKQRYRCVEKSRQVGYSWDFACEALARAHLRETHTAVFVSYNLADAKEKISYCQQMHEELPLEYQKKRIVDSKLEIAFQSNSARGRVSRIISNPSKAPRGKKGDIYLDELAHCANDREIYKGSTALILRSGGQLTVCSSPLGRRGVFWEIARQEVRPYPTYWRQSVPWWLCSFFCTDIVKAAKLARKMSTAERVSRFGTPDIKDQFSSLPIEDFQQEFEVFYSDETMTFFPYELILPATEEDPTLYEDFADAMKMWRGGRLVAGYDIARRRDLSVLALFEELKDGRLWPLMLKEYEKQPFDTQQANLRAMLMLMPIARLSIDATGMGMQLAETLGRDFPGVVREEGFTTVTKEIWCNDFKIHLQRKTVVLPKSRSLISQVHSIKKHVTAAGRVVFDVEADERGKGHADSFWACALACQKERVAAASSGTVGVRIIG